MTISKGESMQRDCKKHNTYTMRLVPSYTPRKVIQTLLASYQRGSFHVPLEKVDVGGRSKQAQEATKSDDSFILSWMLLPVWLHRNMEIWWLLGPFGCTTRDLQLQNAR